MEDTNIVHADIKKKLEENYRDYSLSILISRAIPNFNDGFKPVHKRILWGMHEENFRQFTKVAKISGTILGNYHPHGDSISDTIVRLGQNFAMNIPLISPQGNWGNITGDESAAPRYIEGKLSTLTSKYILADIEKGVVDFTSNYDNTRKEPEELPVRFNQLMVNGAMGIAAGFAVNIPPHNIIEISEATIAFIERRLLGGEKITSSDLLQYVKGPDYPTGGIVSGQDLEEIYKTGEGKIYIRAKMTSNPEKKRIIITEIPYGVYTDDITISIRDAVEAKKVNGISQIVDESKDTPRIVLKVKSESDMKAIVNQLYQYTKCQVTRAVQFLGIKNKELIQFNLVQSVHNFVNFRYRCLVKALNKDLSVAKINLEISQGLLKAIENIDKIIATIKQCDSEKIVVPTLQDKFGFTKLQAQRIADMKLSKLSKISYVEIKKNIVKFEAEIKRITGLLEHKENLLAIIIDEQKEIIDFAKKNGYQRKTTVKNFGIVRQENVKELYPNRDYYIALTKQGFIKKFTKDSFEVQNRNGKGKSIGKLKPTDYVIEIQPCQNHDKVFVFTERGTIYPLDVYKIDESDYLNLGRHVSNYLKLKDNEAVVSLVLCKDEILAKADKYSFIFVTKKGLIKKVLLSEFKNLYETGIIATRTKSGDSLLKVSLYNESNIKKTDTIFIVTKKCKVNRFYINDEEISNSLRPAFGKRGILLKDNDEVIDFTIKYDGDNLTHAVSVTTAGNGKKTPIDVTGTKKVKRVKKDKTGAVISSTVVEVDKTESGYPIKHVGSPGYLVMDVLKRTPTLAGFILVEEKTPISLITKKKVIQVSEEQLLSKNRLTIGNKIIRLQDDEVCSVTTD
ncbi:MAG: DNA topoisomerase (ATP-hydrolyzing) subunit A [Candidatus Dojkabacteria bacterium]